jgi:hypothetical protein
MPRPVASWDAGEGMGCNEAGGSLGSSGEFLAWPSVLNFYLYLDVRLLQGRHSGNFEVTDKR